MLVVVLRQRVMDPPVLDPPMLMALLAPARCENTCNEKIESRCLRIPLAALHHLRCQYEQNLRQPAQRSIFGTHSTDAAYCVRRVIR